MKFYNWLSWFMLLLVKFEEITGAGEDSYNTIHRDGSYEFGYNNPDSYHYADANRNNVVKGEFGGRNPGTGAIDRTVYTAGPRGFRPRGKNVVRKYDLSQSGPRPVGSPDDPYFDPLEDPSYNFSFRTRTYTRDENANRAGDVTGRYSYLDDVGERHNVEFIAGKNTGFHVKTPFPDSNPRAYGPLYFNGRGKPIPRGRTSIQRGLDGSYRFVSAGPDQRRTETSDSTGHVRGSYTYLDDKGVQHSVHYIAGPETGYRVLKNVKGPHLPTIFPFGGPDIIPPDFYDYKDRDIFDLAASGHVKPGGSKPKPSSKEDVDGSNKDKNQDEFTFGSKRPIKPTSKPTSAFGGIGGSDFNKPSFGDDDDGDSDDFVDIFGEGGAGSEISRPSKPGGGRPSKPGGSSIGGGSAGPSRPEGGSISGGSARPSLSETNIGGSINTEGSRPSKPTLIPAPNKPVDTSFEDDDSYAPIPTRPSFGNIPRPGGLGSTVSTSASPTGIPGKKPSKFPVTDVGIGYDDGHGSGKPGRPGQVDNEVGGDFNLFGSESSNARPPYNKRPIIHVGGTDESCKRCAGTIVSNVGDKTFSVPPGASVRAHVQAIDLVPISPSVPSPSEQYKFDTNIRTEQLNAASSQMIISTNSTESNSQEATTEASITTTLIPNT